MAPWFWRIPSLRAGPTDHCAAVLIPLEQAHLHSYSARSGRTEFEEPPDEEEGGEDDYDYEDDDDDGPGKNGGGGEGTGMLEMSAAEYSIAGLRREVRKGGKGQWSDYELKAKIINKAIQDIGMGRYNWQLFVLCGFGWFADNLWMQGVSLILPSLSAEFGVAEKTVRYTTSSIFVGLCFGSFFWGLGSDMMGRRIAFNTTLLITSVFGVMAAYAPTWGWVCFFFAALGFGVGGNLPVDGAVFLEFLPDASSSLLTLLSIWWPIGQLASSLLAWFFIANWPADRGWRLFVTAIGIITFAMFFLRFAIFHLFESPKFLLSKGRQAEAVAVIHGIAYKNGVKTWLTEEILDAVVDETALESVDITHEPPKLSARNVIKNKLASISAQRLKPLFESKKLGLATALIWFCWATIGMGYPLFNAFLPQYFAHGGSPTDAAETGATGATPISAETYRNYAITSVVGVPGSILAAYTVDSDLPFLGRRGTLAISTLVSAVFLFLFVSFGDAPGAMLAFSCVNAFAQNIMYGVLYAFTPEIFPAPVRGAGTGVASFLNRATGLVAPVLAAVMPGDGSTTPIYLSACLILAAFVGMCLIPIETRGRQRL